MWTSYTMCTTLSLFWFFNSILSSYREQQRKREKERDLFTINTYKFLLIKHEKMHTFFLKQISIDVWVSNISLISCWQTANWLEHFKDKFRLIQKKTVLFDFKFLSSTLKFNIRTKQNKKNIRSYMSFANQKS